MTTSKRGFLVLARRDCEVGELVCILFSCRVPIILRKPHGDDKTRQANEPYFRIIGEAISLSEEEGIQPKAICLVSTRLDVRYRLV